MIKVEPVPTDLHQFLEKVYSMFQPLAQSRSLSFALDCPPDLPLLRVGPICLEEVCSNLISNSLKHTPPGGLVLVRAEKVNSALRLTFQDTGYGIPPEELEHEVQLLRQGKMGKSPGAAAWAFSSPGLLWKREEQSSLQAGRGNKSSTLVPPQSANQQFTFLRDFFLLPDRSGVHVLY